jgi:hypothetical protein
MALTRPKYSQIYDTDWKQSVRLATTADVGNLFLANVQPTTVDSVNVNVNDRILVKDQTNARQNGIYIVRSVGTGSNGWWTRTLDAAQSSFVTSGLSAVVSEGATNNGREYRLTTPDPITLDTTELSFLLIAAQPAGANTYVQFNDMNVMSGSPGFTFLKNGNTVNITGNVIASVGSFGNIVNGNIISSGAGQFSGQFNESITTAGVFVGNASSLGTPTPRIGFFNGNTTQNWQIDNSFGDFRWFVPGAVKLNLNPTGNLTVYGSILPSANVAYDLGSPTQKFRSAYFSGNTIYIGGQSISVDTGGTWTFTSQGANINMGATAPFDPPSANIAGNLTVGGTLLANNSPGQNGYVLRSTGTRIEWAAPSAGTGIDSGTSNVSILGTGADVVTTVGGTVVTRASSTAFSINGNLLVNGNLFINGNTTTINSNNLTVNDSMIYLAEENPADLLDIGFTAHVVNPTLNHVGFVRDATDGIWKLFSNVATQPSNIVDFTGAIYSNILVGNVLARTIIAGSFAGNGAALTGLPAGYSNVNAATYLVSGTLATAINTSGNILANGAVVKSMTVNGTTIINDQTQATSATKILDINNGVFDVAVLPRVGGGAYNPLTTVDDSQILFGGGSGQGSGNLVITNWNVNNTGIRIVGNTGLVQIPGQLTINANNSPTAIANGGTNGAGNIGASGATFNTVFAKASQAQYADLAEVYTSDQQYPAGTVVVFGGNAEVTQSRASHDTRIAGVVSTNPAYLMNSTATGVPVALQGRVPCRVLGPVSQGDRVVSSHIAGVAQALDLQQYQPGCIIGKALQAVDSTDISIIEVVVGRL